MDVSMMTIVGMEATTRITTIDEPVSSAAEIGAKARRSLLARAVPNSSPLVAQLSRAPIGPARLAPGGPWKDALRQAPAAIIITDKNVNRIRIGGVCSNALQPAGAESIFTGRRSGEIAKRPASQFHR
jgi:hypothetical protein